jgi:DUF4097 and DUF4098 domain-containing protein YvlB
MKRGSLIAPLLLILIGIVFLVRNIWPDWPVMESLVTWWPFILIGWGVLRMVELIYLHTTGRKLPLAGISGGEWALIIILTVVGSTVWGVRRFTQEGFGKFRIGGVEVFGESFDYDAAPTKIKTGKAPKVFIENYRGVTRVVTADTDEVQVTAKKTIRAMDRATADKAHEQTPLKVDKSGESLSILTNQDRAENAKVSSDLEITVPQGAAVEIRGRGADIDVSGVNGEVSINAEGGGVRALNLGSNLRIDARNTDIVRADQVKGNVSLQGKGRDIEITEVAGEVEISGAYSGETTLRKIEKPVHFVSSMTDIRAQKIPGELSMSLRNLTMTEVTGPIVVKAKTKDVVLQNVTDTVNLDVDNGDVEVRLTRGPVSKMEIQTRSGSIELALPPGAQFKLDAETVRGEVDNQFSDKLTTETRNRGGQITGSVGTGPEIKLQTARGELTLRKSTGDEVPEKATSPAPKPPRPPKAPSTPPERASDQ